MRAKAAGDARKPVPADMPTIASPSPESIDLTAIAAEAADAGGLANLFAQQAATAARAEAFEALQKRLAQPERPGGINLCADLLDANTPREGELVRDVTIRRMLAEGFIKESEKEAFERLAIADPALFDFTAKQRGFRLPSEATDFADLISQQS
jgi:hypothetical protein